MSDGALMLPDRPPSYGGVVLRELRDDDVSMVLDLAQDPYVSLIGSLPRHADAEQAWAFIARQADRLSDRVGYPFCIADAGTDAALGTAGLWLGALEQGRATAGYAVAPRARGAGVAGRALTALTGFAWTLPDVHRIELYIEPWNVASVGTAEVAGYRREGLLRSHQSIGGRRVDMLLYAAVRPD